MCPSCWKWANGHFGALTGRWVKFGLPRRLSCVSRYEKLRPCSSGSLVKSMPGTTFCVQNATCSVSAKKLSTTRSSTSRPTGRTGTTSSGMSLVGVEHVEVERVGEVVVEELHAELPLREVAGLDRVPQVAAVEVGVGAVDLHRLVPHHRLQPELRLPVELHERRPPSALTKRNVWTPKPSMKRNDRGIARSDITHITMCVDSGHQRDEVPEVVVRRLRLREPAVGLLLHRVDEVGELDRVLDEEHRDVVADEVPVALLRVELHREAAHVAGEVGRALVAGDGREPHEHRRPLAGALERGRRG